MMTVSPTPSRFFAGVTLGLTPFVLVAARLGAPLPSCPFKAVTGLECPGCGTGRALTALTHGDLGAVLDHNLLLPVVGSLLLVSLFGMLVNRQPLLARSGWAKPLLVLVLGFWALRLLPFDALSYLDSARAL